jgi:hypothetical protein
MRWMCVGHEFCEQHYNSIAQANRFGGSASLELGWQDCPQTFAMRAPLGM